MVQRNSAAAGCILLLFTFTFIARTGWAQETSSIEINELINFAHLHYYGLGAYTIGDTRVLLLRVPIGITLRHLEKHPWGLQVKVSTTIGVERTILPDNQVEEKVGIATLVPGIEFRIPISRKSTLRPFLDVGVGTDFQSREPVLISAVGVRGEFLFPKERYLFGLEPGVHFSGSHSSRDEGDDTFINAFLKVDARHDLWFKVGEFTPDAGVYGEVGYLFNSLEFVSGNNTQQEIRQQYEVGVSFGFSRGRPKIVLFRWPRFSIGYRFGSELTGIRIRIGGDWVTPLMR